MTVLGLIEKLRHCDPALEVLCFAESADGSTSPFEIDAVSVRDVEKGRDVQGRPAIKFGASKSARPVVVIEITADA